MGLKVRRIRCSIPPRHQRPPWCSNTLAKRKFCMENAYANDINATKAMTTNAAVSVLKSLLLWQAHAQHSAQKMLSHLANDPCAHPSLFESRVAIRGAVRACYWPMPQYSRTRTFCTSLSVTQFLYTPSTFTVCNELLPLQTVQKRSTNYTQSNQCRGPINVGSQQRYVDLGKPT